MEVEFSAHEADGVLFYVQQNLGGSGDFLALVLNNGYGFIILLIYVVIYSPLQFFKHCSFFSHIHIHRYLEARIDLGNGIIVLKSPKPVDLFTRTLVSVRTYGR